jgi:GTP pyrophosphokinase
VVTVRTSSPETHIDQPLTKERWLETIKAARPEDEYSRIAQAIEFLVAHNSSDDFILLSIAVADTLVGLEADTDTLITGLIHFHPEVESAEYEVVEQLFGTTVALLIQGLKEMSFLGVQTEGQDSLLKDHAEGLRKMLLAIVKDVRVILVKLASRLQCMRLLKDKTVEQQQIIAHETQEIFAPLANRLGIWQLKWELEDLSFRYLHPITYKRIAKLLDEKRLEREDYINDVIDVLKSALEPMNIQAEITGRPKHIYSIWRKMVRKGVDFDQIFDVRAVRVLVDRLEQCYAVLGVAHAKWQHISGEFDDYIATPKENMYQSLHTALVGPGGKALEVQIRTFDMHQHAELGVASHWRYKEGGQYDDQYERRLSWMRQLLEAKDDDVDDLMERFKEEVSEDRVYVFTPMGRVLDLVQGATVLDFAYLIHTDIGHRCKGAKVNGAIVPLTYELKSGETVEILTAKIPNPSKNWLSPHLDYIRTPKARAKVRHWFKQLDRDEHLQSGKAILDKALQRMGLEKDLAKLLSRFKREDEETLLVDIGRGGITSMQITAFIHAEQSGATAPEPPVFKQPSRSKAGGEIEILGVENLLTQMAGCCKPLPGDPIIGYITRGRGVTIHRQDCLSVTALAGVEQDRLIEVSWNIDPATAFPVDIFIRAEDRRGLLSDISSILTYERINVLSTQSFTNPKSHIADFSLTLEVKDIEQLSKVLEKLGQIASVIDVFRKSK